MSHFFKVMTEQDGKKIHIQKSHIFFRIVSNQFLVLDNNKELSSVRDLGAGRTRAAGSR